MSFVISVFVKNVDVYFTINLLLFTFLLVIIFFSLISKISLKIKKIKILNIRFYQHFIIFQLHLIILFKYL